MATPFSYTQQHYASSNIKPAVKGATLFGYDVTQVESVVDEMDNSWMESGDMTSQLQQFVVRGADGPSLLFGRFFRVHKSTSTVSVSVPV